MFSKLEIVRVNEPIQLSLTPANKRKRHRTMVISPKNGFVKIPPDDKNVSMVKIIATPATPVQKSPPRPRNDTSNYPYGTSLIRRRRLPQPHPMVSKYGHVFEELGKLLQTHDSTHVQIQVNASCGNSFQYLKSAIVKLHNLTILAGMQIASQCLPHDSQTISNFKRHEDRGDLLRNVTDVVPRSACYADSGLHQLYISGATKKDLMDAMTLCLSVIDQYPNIFNVNIIKLSYPSLASFHLSTYSEFTNTSAV
ncbi:protein UL117 [Saimiriine betaherpesvirus 4]|uniref:Protein UL117 n=1 Tax=Saimiriine betaherpesvirus 4 TaxID=1535247 RepID=G8XT14_9BETA|nr:protein UL117 [Saimiriine betaherpesvirus 4]AEV80960.1 protein UL117 [Saimiriine betaherpesvirus 4]